MPGPDRLPGPVHLGQIPPRDPAPVPVDDALEYRPRIRELPPRPTCRAPERAEDADHPDERGVQADAARRALPADPRPQRPTRNTRGDEETRARQTRRELRLERLTLPEVPT